jgi:hypothetical protein
MTEIFDAGFEVENDICFLRDAAKTTLGRRIYDLFWEIAERNSRIRDREDRVE